ncbi:hypothetical protein CPT_Mydo_074 [Proteus phage Mydo]|uniref:Uncharacterized protein n=1 Tax=Proteus phage Mydo TaxID=2483610 RepID=A0A3G8F164_9CAUD|nr:hypothetical protein HWB97_gp074 [Proteus phage Mydo]AZF87649.1 hypothetical protein CPT_Mydo_074 [Proteus phage Mydo]
MTKSEFFKMLDNHLESHNYTFDHFGNRIKREDRQYTANEIEAFTHSEPEEKIVKLKAADSNYPWIFHSSGWCLADCWYITAISHRTKAAAEKQHKIFTRWIAEYKELNK